MLNFSQTNLNNNYDRPGFEPSRDNDPSGKLDMVIEWLLISLLAFMPLAFGVVHAWSQQVVVVVSGIIVMCFMLKLILSKQPHFIWTWAYIPLSAFLILVVFQLVPLPGRLAEIVSPGTVAFRKELLGDLQNADGILKFTTVSLYPYATKSDLRIILALAGVFVVVLNMYNRPRMIKRLLAVLTVIGGIIAVITLAQNLFGNGKIYWFISSRNTEGNSGPFVNHCNYGQYMNLSIGAAIGLFMVKIHDIFGGGKITLPVVLDYLLCRRAIKLWLIIGVIIIGMTTIFTSLTRGGVISMLIAMGMVTMLLSSKHHLRSHGWTMVVASLLAFICILYTGFDAVFDRMASLRDLHQAGSYRMQVLKDITATWYRFPLLGTGLGTHSVVYPMSDRTNTSALAAYAENEYAQTLEETGLAGLSLLAVFGIIICSSCVKAIRSNKPPVSSAVYGLSFGILAILIQSISDFGQHLPANAFLSVIFCALIIAVQKQEVLNIKYSVSPFRREQKALCISGFCFVGTLLIWVYIGANNSRLAEQDWNNVRTIEKNLALTDWQGTETVYSDLLLFARAAMEREPENVKYRYWLNVYRWRFINHSSNPGVTDVPACNDSIPEIRDIVEQLHRACIYCPAYGPAYTLAGQLEKFILNDSLGTDRIKKGYLLAPGDPVVCYISGYLDLVEGRYEDCRIKFDKAVRLDERFYRDVAAIYIDNLSRPDLAVTLAGDNVSRLNYLVDTFSESQYEDLVLQCRIRIQNILEQQCSKPDASDQALVSLAEIYMRQQKPGKAIDCYQRALALNYSQVRWRIELAKALAAANSLPQALHEAKICLRINPNSVEAQKLVADLSMHPAAWENLADSK
jgi:tetratricopeptide (TPR) repeat protein